MTLHEAIWKRIAELCIEQNLTLDDLSANCGVSMSALDDIFLGTKRTRVSTIEKICVGFHISLADFFCSNLFLDLEPEK